MRIVPPIASFTAQWLTRGCSSEDEESRDGDDDVSMDGNRPEGQAKPTVKKPGDLTEYNLETYDEDDANEAELGPFTNIKGLTYYRSNDEDPYITLKDVSTEILHLGPPIFTHADFYRTTKTRRIFYPPTTS